MPREPEPITFQQRPDGVYVAGPWPKLVLIADDLLTAPDGELMKVAGDLITFEVRNGSADYWCVGESVHGATPFERGGCIYSLGAIDAA